jgi:TPR repeat protein
MALLEKAAGQGHAYAMVKLRSIHEVRKEYDRAFKWATKGAEAGMPEAMFDLGVMLHQGRAEVAPDHPAAADWYRRAADAGHRDAANNLSQMYSVGCGGPDRQCLPRHHSTSCTLVFLLNGGT